MLCNTLVANSSICTSELLFHNCTDSVETELVVLSTYLCKLNLTCFGFIFRQIFACANSLCFMRATIWPFQLSRLLKAWLSYMKFSHLNLTALGKCNIYSCLWLSCVLCTIFEWPCFQFWMPSVRMLWFRCYELCHCPLVSILFLPEVWAPNLHYCFKSYNNRVKYWILLCIQY